MISAKVIIQKQNYKKKSKTEINNSTVSFSEPNEETQSIRKGFLLNQQQKDTSWYYMYILTLLKEANCKRDQYYSSRSIQTLFFKENQRWKSKHSFLNPQKNTIKILYAESKHSNDVNLLNLCVLEFISG